VVLSILNDPPSGTQKNCLVWPELKVRGFTTPEKVEHGDAGEKGPHGISPSSQVPHKESVIDVGLIASIAQQQQPTEQFPQSSLNEISPSWLVDDFCRSALSHPVVIMMNVEQINIIEKMVLFIVVILKHIKGEHWPLKTL
jgi:hypothetical protein